MKKKSIKIKKDVVWQIGICRKCGDVVISTYRHDFDQCRCGLSFLDGGEDYLRLTGDTMVINVKMLRSDVEKIARTRLCLPSQVKL